MKHTIQLHIVLRFLGVLLFLLPSVVFAESEPPVEPSRIIQFVSRNIRPYIEAADGMRDVLAEVSGVELEVVNLDKLSMKASEDLAQKLRLEKDIALFAAIGPEAAAFIWDSFRNDYPPKIYSIILNPEKVIGAEIALCGIALNIPAEIQVNMIHNAFGSIKRVGIFYDTANNEQFCLEAVESASNLGITIVALQVNSMKDIPSLLDKALKSVDCVWLIPDKTVISESIARYIIKQAVIKNIPVVGYNQFFYESGAAMSFVFDYGALGRQTGELAGELVSQHRPCESQIPVFQVWLNGVVIDKLGMKIKQTIKPPMMMGP